MKKILIIQTAFIGDVILATSLLEKLHQFKIEKIDFLLRKGNEGLLVNHPFLNKIYIWDKKNNKYSGLFSIIADIRKEKYDYVINLQRFFSTGLITALSGAKTKIGFQKNPLSFLFTLRYPHVIDVNSNIHEIQRNMLLLETLVDDNIVPNPKLYPSNADFVKIQGQKPYVTISPTSVWFTKQYPLNKWVDVVNTIDSSITIYLLGAKNDADICEYLKTQTSHPNVEVMAGKLTFLESAALMSSAEMNFTNDSAPMHLSSAMNAPVTAIFCSTVPAFGFGPLSDTSKIVEIPFKLSCRPCGLHGYKVCPQKHFKCSEITSKAIIGNISTIIR